MTFQSLNTIETTLIAFMAIAWLWQMGYLYRRIRPVSFFKQKDQTPVKNSDLPPASVVISARNEAENLELFLPSILSQDYPEFQVVVVNDGSEDETDMVLSRLKAQHPNLYITSIAPNKKFYHGKKLPLSLGIKAAKYHHIVLTDADCQPASNQWLKQMITPMLKQNKEMVLGIGNYQKKRGLNNLWLRYDTFTIAIQYLGFALSGRPYMATGRNLAYTKNLFNKTNGFKSHIYIASGDDDLFVQEAANKQNTTISIRKEAHTISIPPENFRKWIEQKHRHLTTSHHYRRSIKLSLVMEPLTREIFWGITVYSIFFPNFGTIILPFSVLLLTNKFIFWKMASDKTALGKIFWGLAIFDMIQPIILAFVHLGNMTRPKQRKWK